MVHAVDGVSLTVGRGETVGLIGESGSGKSTLSRTIMGVYRPTAGRVLFDGDRCPSGEGHGGAPDPPPDADGVPEPLLVGEPALHRHADHPRADEGPAARHAQPSGSGGPASCWRWSASPAELAGRYPHELSGGQLQRVGIARALSTNPDFLIADEPTAALDVSVRAQVMNLLIDLKQELNLSLLFISHDLASVSYIADRVAVLYLGRLVECADTDELERDPLHPTPRRCWRRCRALTRTRRAPVPGAERRDPLAGEPARPAATTTPAARMAEERCRAEYPEIIEPLLRPDRLLALSCPAPPTSWRRRRPARVAGGASGDGDVATRRDRVPR